MPGEKPHLLGEFDLHIGFGEDLFHPFVDLSHAHKLHDPETDNDQREDSDDDPDSYGNFVIPENHVASP